MLSQYANALDGARPSGVVTIQLKLNKESYSSDDSVLINGKLWLINATQVTIGLEKNHNLMVITKNVTVSENKTFATSFIIPKDIDAKSWSVVATASEGTLIQDLDFHPAPLTPLKQFKSGISAMDVTCSVGYVLTIKSGDGSPVCVRPLTVKILTERGWSKFESAQSDHSTNAKTNPFGIVGLVYYYGGGPCGVGVCPLNTFNLKMNSNYTTYLLGYNICNDNSCITRNSLSVLLPLDVIGMPDYKFIALPENPQWKYADVFHIQVEVSSIPDNTTAVWTDLGNSTTIH